MQQPLTSASQSLYRRLARNMTYLVSGTGAAAIFGMLALAFNVRALSAEEFGLLVLLQASALTLVGFMSFGTQQPVIKLGAAALAKEDLPRLGQLIGLGFSFDIFAATVASATAFLVIFLAGDLLGISPALRGLASVFALSLLFNGYLTSSGVFRLLNRFGLMSFIQAGGAAAILAASALFYFIGADFAAYVWMWASLTALTVQVQLFTSLHMIRKRGVKISFDYRAMEQADIKAFFSYCWTTWGTSSTETVRTNGDSLLVGWLVGVEAAGFYGVAKQVAGVLRKMTVIYASAVFPEVAKLAADGDTAGARRLRRRMIWVGCGFGAFAVAAMALVGRPLLAFGFGPSFEASYPALILLMLAAALQLISHTLAIYVQVFVSPVRLFSIYLIGFTIYVLAAPLATLAFGMAGTAFAQVLFSVSTILISAGITNRALNARAGAGASGE